MDGLESGIFNGIKPTTVDSPGDSSSAVQPGKVGYYDDNYTGYRGDEASNTNPALPTECDDEYGSNGTSMDMFRRLGGVS